MGRRVFPVGPFFSIFLMADMAPKLGKDSGITRLALMVYALILLIVVRKLV